MGEGGPHKKFSILLPILALELTYEALFIPVSGIRLTPSRKKVMAD
jgi:hypothetical protein